MSLDHVTIAERLAYGRPLDPQDDDTPIRVVPRPATALIGRILLGTIFVVSGFAKLIDPTGAIEHMTAAGIPAPEVLVFVAAFAELLGGLAVMTGFLSRVAALGLVVFLIPTTLLFHDFWNYEGQAQVMQMANFMKNLGIAGGLCLLIAHGAGRYSADYALRRPMQP